MTFRSEPIQEFNRKQLRASILRAEIDRLNDEVYALLEVIDAKTEMLRECEEE